MLLIELVDKLFTSYPDTLSTLTVSQLTNFTALSAEFIKRTDGAYGESPHEAPIEFLTQCLDPAQPMATWARLWNLTFDHLPSCAYNTNLFEKHGIPFLHRPKDALIIPQHTFNPPTKHCITCTTDVHGNPVTLQTRHQVCGYLFDIDGIKTVQSFSGYCRSCQITYTPCFLRRGDVREYYTLEEGHPKDFFQVTRHYFMTHRLADHLNHLQAIAVVSIYNLVLIYNQAHAAVNTTYPNDFRQARYTRQISHHVMSQGLDIYRLMRSFHARGVRLRSDANGADDRRFFSAMKQHLMWLEQEGSPYFSHVCSVCTAIEPIPDSDEATIMRAVVTDGVTIGHWSCSASEAQLKHLDPNGPNYCDVPLDHVNDRFCPLHNFLHNMCYAQPCLKPVQDGTKTCDNQEHINAFKEFKSRNKSLFGLPKRMKRPNTHIKLDPSSILAPETGEVTLTEDDLLYGDLDEREHESARDGGESKKPKKPLFTRHRSHNEQLAVSPCGVVVGRKTFYKSESVTKVKEFIYEMFPNQMPQVIFYDNACGLYSHIQTSPEDSKRFARTLLPVDAFHIKSHKVSHTACRMNNDPNLFPELKVIISPNGAWKWRFNSSAAEIVNAWFGRFDPMCRGMHPIKYAFVLEEFIRIHNDRLVERLGKRPDVRFCLNVEYTSLPL